ncbi:unnamed protein product [Dovyalis caffra]|uniref:TIR domain-containing protein n=1 Tax=Dovyalis caffra TaxID=77055 RepID=A0AAV1QQ08_9ROSI|nr:unnamed protein product [Dovyalis caffra]
MASSSTSTPIPPKKYDVFLSFRGEDTRCGFTSHLYHALNQNKKIPTFIDNDLVRGDEISSSLSKTIKESKLSVIIFSENYASSKWCLEELVQMLECRNDNGQRVVPVFYSVDPSHVRNQTGRFGDAFARLIKEKALAMDKVQSFRSALKDAASLSGWGLTKSEGWERHRATRVLEGCYPSALYDISTLTDKCLITASSSNLGMHDLLQEMALSIVRAESKNPGKRSRLCDPDDVVHVLKKKKGSDRIEGISFDTSKLSREMHLESDAFAKMDRLRFLEFYGGYPFTRLHLPSSGLKYLSDELRYLRWDGFPSKSLPQNFCAENLVELDFSWSKVEKLWRGEQFPEGLRDIEYLDLSGTAIEEVPSSIQFLTRLEVLFMKGTPIRELPELPPSLTLLRAGDCASLETISTVNLRSGWIRLDFSNCFKLDQKALLADMHLKFQSPEKRNIEMILPGNEIPEWFRDQGVGSSVTVRFPSNCQQLRGIAFCFAFLIPADDLICNFIKGNVSIKFGCLVKTKNGEHEVLGDVQTCGNFTTSYYSDHRALKYDDIVSLFTNYFGIGDQFSNYSGNENELSKYSGKEVTFEFYPTVKFFDPMRTEKLCKVKSCGRHRAWHSNESWSNNSTTDGCDGTEKGPSGDHSSPENLNTLQKLPLLQFYISALFCTYKLDPALNGLKAKFPFSDLADHELILVYSLYLRVLYGLSYTSMDGMIGCTSLMPFSLAYSELAFSISHVSAKITVKTAKWMPLNVGL